MMPPKLALTTEETATACGVSKDTVKRAIRAGRLRAKRSGRTDEGDPAGKYLILLADIEAWLSNLEDA